MNHNRSGHEISLGWTLVFETNYYNCCEHNPCIFLWNGHGLLLFFITFNKIFFTNAALCCFFKINLSSSVITIGFSSDDQTCSISFWSLSTRICAMFSSSVCLVCYTEQVQAFSHDKQYNYRNPKVHAFDNLSCNFFLDLVHKFEPRFSRAFQISVNCNWNSDWMLVVFKVQNWTFFWRLDFHRLMFFTIFNMFW